MHWNLGIRGRLADTRTALFRGRWRGAKGGGEREHYFRREIRLLRCAIKDAEFHNISSRKAAACRGEGPSLPHKETSTPARERRALALCLSSCTHTTPYMCAATLETPIYSANDHVCIEIESGLLRFSIRGTDHPRGSVRTLYGFVVVPLIYPSIYSRLWLTSTTFLIGYCLRRLKENNATRVFSYVKAFHSLPAL